MQDGTLDRPDFVTDKGMATFDELTKSLERFIETGKQAGVNIKQATSTKQLGDETKRLTVAQSELLKIEKQIEVANARANKAYQDQQKALAAIKNEQKERLALGNKEAKQVTEMNSSVKQLEAALNKNRVAYKSLADEEARNSKEGKELKAVIDQQDAAVKKLNGGLGDFRDNVGNYAGALKGLKNELKSAKDEMAFLAKNTGTTSPEFVKAAAKAGDLKDQINDLNDQIKVTAGNKFENLGASLKDVGSKLLSLDFEGAANSAKQFAAISKSLTFKEITEGLKSFGTTLATVGKAILTNPIFIIAGVVTAAALAFKYFRDEQEKASKRAIDRYARELEALTARYDTEIKLQKILGNQTFALEKAKQQAIIETSKKSIEKLGEVSRFDLVQSLIQRSYVKTLNEDKLKQLGEFTIASRNASNELKVIAAEQAEFEKNAINDLYEQKKKDIFSLEAFNLKVQIEAQEEIAKNDQNGFDKRIAAIKKATNLKNQIAKLERDNEIDQANLTAEAILLIDAQLRDKLNQNRKDAAKETKDVNDDLAKNIQANMKKAGDDVAKNLKKPVEQTTESIKQLEGEVGDMGVTFEHVTDNAGFKFRKFFSDLSEGLQKVKQEFLTWGGAISDLFNSLTAARIQKLNEESEANKEKLANDLKLAGDNELAKSKIQEDFAKKEAELEKRKRAEARKAAILDKVLALAAAAINTALAITNQLKGGDPYTAFARAAFAGVLGGLQVAAIAVKPIPSYFKGAKPGEHPGGLAQVGEQGVELMRSPSGQLSLTPSSSTIMNVPRGTEVIPHDKTMQMLAMGALQQNGGSRQVTNSDPALLNELQKVNSNLKNIHPARMPNLVNSSGTVYGAFADAKNNIRIRRIANLGRFIKDL